MKRDEITRLTKELIDIQEQLYNLRDDDPAIKETVLGALSDVEAAKEKLKSILFLPL